jgi:hypothetical protein
MAEGFRDFANAWAEYHVEVDEYRELDGERVLVLNRASARGKISGLEVGQLWSKGASLVHVRDDNVTRFVFFFDRERALADGLATETDPR